LIPLYEFTNTFIGVGGGSLINVRDPDVLVENRDYYLYTGSFNGTVGTGSGLRSARPATCTPLVAYWATDENNLYQCSATNTWTLFYTPYVYPHPLNTNTVTPAGAGSAHLRGR